MCSPQVIQIDSLRHPYCSCPELLLHRLVLCGPPFFCKSAGLTLPDCVGNGAVRLLSWAKEEVDDEKNDGSAGERDRPSPVVHDIAVMAFESLLLLIAGWHWRLIHLVPALGAYVEVSEE